MIKSQTSEGKWESTGRALTMNVSLLTTKLFKSDILTLFGLGSSPGWLEAMISTVLDVWRAVVAMVKAETR